MFRHVVENQHMLRLDSTHLLFLFKQSSHLTQEIEILKCVHLLQKFEDCISKIYFITRLSSPLNRIYLDITKKNELLK